MVVSQEEPASQKQPRRAADGRAQELPVHQPPRAKAPSAEPLPDAVEEVQTPRVAAIKRPEQRLTKHDQSHQFDVPAASPITQSLKEQPDSGEIQGFDFYIDPLNAKQPRQPPQEIMEAEMAAELLKNAQIPFIIQSEDTGIFGPGNMPSPRGARLLVPEGDIKRAQELLKRVFGETE